MSLKDDKGLRQEETYSLPVNIEYIQKTLEDDFLYDKFVSEDPSESTTIEEEDIVEDITNDGSTTISNPDEYEDEQLQGVKVEYFPGEDELTEDQLYNELFTDDESLKSDGLEEA